MEDNRLASAEGIGREISRFSDNDAVLMWRIGGALSFEQAAPNERFQGTLPLRVNAPEPRRWATQK